MASPDPIAAERAHYLALLGWTIDDPAVTLSQLRGGSCPTPPHGGVSYH